MEDGLLAPSDVQELLGTLREIYMDTEHVPLQEIRTDSIECLKARQALDKLKGKRESLVHSSMFREAHPECLTAEELAEKVGSSTNLLKKGTLSTCHIV